MSRYIHCTTTAVFGLLVVFSGSLAARADSDVSPMGAYQLRTEAILAATTLDDVAHLLSEEDAAFVAELSPRERAEGLAHWQASLRERPERAVAERIDGDRAVVLIEDADALPTGVRVAIMERIDGSWTVVGDAWLQGGVPGSRGSYLVSGATTVELAGAMISISAVNGVPILVVGDPLAALLTDTEQDRVQIPLPLELADACFELGVIDLATVATDGEYGVTVHGGFFPAGEEVEAYRASFQGSLDIVAIDGDRFSGTYSFSASTEGGDRVAVTGAIERGVMPCAAW